jgi:hypothetical protein
MKRRKLVTLMPAGALVATLALGGCSLTSSALGHPHAVSVFHLEVGQCLDPPSKIVAQVSTLEVLSCKAPHTQQVFALVSDRAGSLYPGPGSLERFANASCLQHFASFVGIPYQQSSLFFTYLLPTVRSWEAGDHTVTCVITTTGAKLTSSVQGSKR